MSQSKILQNPSSKKFVIIAPQRSERPNDRAQVNVCPFCPGNEKETPPEVSRTPNAGAWKVRVVPNKYPITSIHEVVVLNPDHTRNSFDYSPPEWKTIFSVYRERFNSLKEKGRVSIFHNHGAEAGESLEHDHSQILVIPSQIELELQPTEPVENIVHESQHFVVYAPTASSWPYETVLLPKKRDQSFGQVEKAEIEDLAEIFPRLLKKLEANQKVNFPFNYYIYHDQDWYIRLIPRLKTPAGFELATGIFVNSQDPKEAAVKLSW